MEIGDDPDEGEVIDIGSTTAASGETEELENVQAPTASSGGGTVVEGPGAGISAPGAGLIPPGDAAGPGVSSVITAPPG